MSYIRTEDIVMAYQSMNTYLYYLKRTFVLSDFGFVFEDKQEEFSYQSEISQSMTLIGSSFYVPEGFGLFMVALSSRADIHNRSYIKLQALVANVGGVINFIFMFAKMLTNYITSKSLHLEYVNHRCNYKSADSNFNRNKISFNTGISNTTNFKIYTVPVQLQQMQQR
jgi:hypothetical protein